MYLAGFWPAARVLRNSNCDPRSKYRKIIAIITCAWPSAVSEVRSREGVKLSFSDQPSANTTILCFGPDINLPASRNTLNTTNPAIQHQYTKSTRLPYMRSGLKTPAECFAISPLINSHATSSGAVVYSSSSCPYPGTFGSPYLSQATITSTPFAIHRWKGERNIQGITNLTPAMFQHQQWTLSPPTRACQL